jgi:hypothetical protein
MNYKGWPIYDVMEFLYLFCVLVLSSLNRDVNNERPSGVNFINILHALFSPIFFCLKVTKPNCNFIKVLQPAFTRADPKSAKKTVKLLVFFPLPGSVCAKAGHRTLMKLTTELFIENPFCK